MSSISMLGERNVTCFIPSLVIVGVRGVPGEIIRDDEEVIGVRGDGIRLVGDVCGILDVEVARRLA